MPDFRHLDADAILHTLVKLEQRIGERFPDANLRKVAGELVDTARATCETVRRIGKPNRWIRLAVAILLLAIGITLLGLPAVIHRWGRIDTLLDFIQVFEPTLGAIFFLSAFVAFLVSIELRLKRSRVLRALRELRAVAHVVDMHQLTKDPAILLSRGPRTAASPQRTLTEFELGRYYDYCCEMLSLISKIAALYIQDFPDPVATTAVDEIESLTTGLSRKIWQKIMLLDRDRAE